MDMFRTWKPDAEGGAVVLMQTENEAAMQQMKRLRLEHAHSLQHLTEENARLQRTLAHIQVQRHTLHFFVLPCGRVDSAVVATPWSTKSGLHSKATQV